MEFFKKIVNKNFFTKNFMAPFYGCGSTVLRLKYQYEKTVYLLLQSPEEFIVLIWSRSEGWKAKSTVESPFKPLNLEAKKLHNRCLKMF